MNTRVYKFYVKSLPYEVKMAHSIVFHTDVELATNDWTVSCKECVEHVCMFLLDASKFVSEGRVMHVCMFPGRMR